MNEKFETDKISQFNIETVSMSNGSSISFCKERAIITSIKLFNGKEAIEIFYMDESTLNNKGVSIKGGIPILFPNAGPIPDEMKNGEFANLKQHGFARDQKWESVETMEGITATLRANQDTKKLYNYDFLLSLIAKFEKDGSLTIVQEIENFEKEKEMPVAYGLHPYFKVSNEEKKNIKFNFKGGKVIENQFNTWSNSVAISIDNPGVPMRIEIPGLDVLVLNASKEYKKIWVWSLPDKDFICVEPVMRNEGGIINDPEMIKPGDIYSASFSMKLEKQ